MPIRKEFNEWECKYCHSVYPLEPMALACEQGHDIVYIPIHREDLQRLIQFIFTKDESLITERLAKTLSKYTNGMRN